MTRRARDVRAVADGAAECRVVEHRIAGEKPLEFVPVAPVGGVAVVREQILDFEPVDRFLGRQDAAWVTGKR